MVVRHKPNYLTKFASSNLSLIIMNKIFLTALITLSTLNVMAQNKITQTAGRTQLGEFAPKFAELNDDVLFGEAVWNDSTLSLHDHSVVTISILLGKGMTDSSFHSHLEMGKKHGITRKEIAAILTQAAFYAGWPNAWAGFRIAKEVWADNNDAATEKERFQQQMIFPIGEPNTANHYTSSNCLLKLHKSDNYTLPSFLTASTNSIATEFLFPKTHFWYTNGSQNPTLHRQPLPFHENQTQVSWEIMNMLRISFIF